MRRFVTVRANGITPTEADEIIVTAIGPRGGTVATLGLHPVQAANLARALEAALKDYRK